MIFRPSTEGFKFTINSVTKRFQFGSQISLIWSSRSIKFRKEDQSHILFQIKVYIGIILLQSFEFKDEFFSKKRKRQFHLQGSFVLSGKLNNAIFFHLNYLLNNLWDFNNSGEENKLIQLCQKLLDIFNLNFEILICSFGFSQISKESIHIGFNIFD